MLSTNRFHEVVRPAIRDVDDHGETVTYAAKVAKRKFSRYVHGMSAIGFTPQLNEIEELRNAYGAMNDVLRNLRNVRECLRREDFRMADHHLRAAEWHVGQAKQRIAAVGQSKPGSKLKK